MCVCVCVCVRVHKDMHAHTPGLQIPMSSGGVHAGNIPEVVNSTALTLGQYC